MEISWSLGRAVFSISGKFYEGTSACDWDLQIDGILLEEEPERTGRIKRRADLESFRELSAPPPINFANKTEILTFFSDIMISVS